MKYCEEYAALLDLYVDGELSPEEMAAVQEHLDQCPDCRRYVDEILEIRAAFPDVEETPVPEGFADGVMEAIRAASPAPRKTTHRKTGRRWIKVLAPLAACIAVAVLVAPLRPWEHSQQETAQVAQDVAAAEAAQADPQTEPASGDSASGEIAPKQFGAAVTETEPEIAADTIPEEAPANTRQNPAAEQASEPAPEQNPASAETQMADPAENNSTAATGKETAQEPESDAQGGVTAATTEEPVFQDTPANYDSQQEEAVGPSASVYTGEEGTEAWVAHGNVVFAQVAFLTQEEAGQALAGYTGKPYSDAQRPEEGVLGMGYAMDPEDYQQILEAAGKSPEAQADPDRTTEQCCIVVLTAEE